MASDVMSVRLWLSQIVVLSVVVDAPGRLVADARGLTVNAVARRHRVGWHAVMALVIAYRGASWGITAAAGAAECCWWRGPRSASGTAT
ncbi:hypothetical protein [Candidatus Poriferisodalis sp.]|uniref:hypothetical protein n=1 Tax=Candidatus Poriferisodalis sp. TaxID=3101277 RepID=UPI003B012C10